MSADEALTEVTDVTPTEAIEFNELLSDHELCPLDDVNSPDYSPGS